METPTLGPYLTKNQCDSNESSSRPPGQGVRRMRLTIRSSMLRWLHHFFVEYQTQIGRKADLGARSAGRRPEIHGWIESKLNVLRSSSFYLLNSYKFSARFTTHNHFNSFYHTSLISYSTIESASMRSWACFMASGS